MTWSPVKARSRPRAQCALEDQRPEHIPNRRSGAIPGIRGWKRAGGGYAGWIQPPRESTGTSNQICGFWPFSVGAGAPLIGAPLGKHKISRVTVCCDPISWFQIGGFITAPNAFILAREGFGKSTVVQRILTACDYFGTIPLVLGDLKGEYVELIKALGGDHIPIGRGRGYLNLLDMAAVRDAMKLVGQSDLTSKQKTTLRAELLVDARGRRLAAVSALATLQRQKALEDHEDLVLGVALEMLDERFKRSDPILKDLVDLLEGDPMDLPDRVSERVPVDRLRDAVYDKGDIEEYHRLTGPLIRTMRGLLREGRIGKTFSQKTSRRLDLDRGGVFDISSIPFDQTELVAAALSVCWGVGFSAVHTRVALGEAGVLPMRHYQVAIDELWRALFAGHGMAGRVSALTRLTRQQGLGLIQITHTIKDLLSLATEHERNMALGIVERSGILIAGALPPGENKYLREIKGFSDEECKLINSWQNPPPWGSKPSKVPPYVGHFLIKVGDRAGIPFQLERSAAEVALGHDTSHLWHPQKGTAA